MENTYVIYGISASLLFNVFPSQANSFLEVIPEKLLINLYILPVENYEITQ